MKPCLSSLSPSKSLSPRKGTGHLSPSGGGEIELPVIAPGHHVHRRPGGEEPGGAGHGYSEHWGKEIVNQRIRFLHLSPDHPHARNENLAPRKSASYLSKGEPQKRCQTPFSFPRHPLIHLCNPHRLRRQRPRKDSRPLFRRRRSYSNSTISPTAMRLEFMALA